jgi:2',3'-cyclic-nucleotide 2'-phosphodiesterase (5'-nucleotidase family)
MKFQHSFLTLITWFLLQACNTQYVQTGKQTSSTRIQYDSLKLYDSTAHYFIAPYKKQLDAQMNVVIGSTQTTLLKERPEGTLGNLIADAAVWYATKNYPKPIDVSVMNYGGIRIPSIAAGNITVGKIYELMPFDNMLDVLEINGTTLNELLQLVAANGGWPLAGVQFTISNNKAVDIRIGGELLQLNKTYTLITSDYIANGGDNAVMLKNYSKRTGLNYKLRDAILEYVKSAGQLNMQNNGRITVKP